MTDIEDNNEPELDTNRRLLNEIHDVFEEIFEYNDYTWDELEFQIAYTQQRKIAQIPCDADLYTYDKQFLEDIYSYFSYYSHKLDKSVYKPVSRNQLIHNVLITLNEIIQFDYKRMKEDNESFYIELNKVILKPQRIENMASNYGVDFFEYLDAIM